MDSADFDRFNRKYEIDPSGCWLWTGCKSLGGYGYFKACGKQVYAHRVSWIANRGDIPYGMQVCHRCDVRSCVNPDHLFLGTPADNMADRDAKGRHRPPLGVAHGMAKLSEAQVRSIRADGRSQAAIAKDFGISQALVHRIKARVLWRHVA